MTSPTTYAAFSNKPGTPISSPNMKGTFFYPPLSSPTAPNTRYSCSDGRYSGDASSNPRTPTGRVQTPPFPFPGRETKEKAMQAILNSVAAIPPNLIAVASGFSDTVVRQKDMTDDRKRLAENLKLFPEHSFLDTSQEEMPEVQIDCKKSHSLAP